MDKLQQAQAILQQAIATHHPRAIFVLFSGGHDSLTLASVAHRLIGPQITATVHIATGTGIPETFSFVEATCAAHGWNLQVYRPPRDEETGVPGTQYREMVLKYGFPGKGAHLFPYTLLKERALDQLIRDSKHKMSDRILLITGVRRQESQRRMGHVQAVRRAGATVWVAPLIDWSADDCGQWIADHALPRNPVADLLHMSGECLCGAFAKPGELEEIGRWFPDTAARITALQVEAQACGMPCRWGMPLSANEVMQRHLAKVGLEQMELPLCHSCMKEVQ